MRVTDKLRRLIAQRAGEDQLREAAVSGGMITLGEDGLAKVKSGVTTPEELLRVVTEVREMRTLCPGCGARGRRRLRRLPALRQARSAAAARTAAARCSPAGISVRTARRAPPRRGASVDEAAARQRQGCREGRRELPAANVAEFKK